MALVENVESEAVTFILAALLPAPYATCWTMFLVMKEPILNQWRRDLLVASSRTSE